MKGLGSGENGEFTFLDMLAIMSFWVGVENLNMNLTQEDKQDLQKDLADKADILLKEIHAHLESQDEKIDFIMKRLEDKDGTYTKT